MFLLDVTGAYVAGFFMLTGYMGEVATDRRSVKEVPKDDLRMT